MPLIMVSGYPCSGKTYRATQIVDYFTKRLSSGVSSQQSKPQAKSRPSQIHLVSDHTLHLPRSVYAAARPEKDARAALMSAVKRLLTKNDIVILDTGNYIKGWRYQLHCEAKNIGTPSCVVHVGVPEDKCRENNEARLASAAKTESTQNGVENVTVGGDAQGDPYDTTVFEELLMRYEEPNGMTRWDSPLFTVPWDDETPPLEALWMDLVEQVGSDGKDKVVKPNLATVVTPAAKSDHLYELERCTTAILGQIQAYLRDHPSEGGGTVSVPTSILRSENSGSAGSETDAGTVLDIELPISPPSLPHLQRLKRQFIALHRQQMGSMGMGQMGAAGASADSLTPQRAAELFVDWLNDTFAKG